MKTKKNTAAKKPAAAAKKPAPSVFLEKEYRAKSPILFRGKRVARGATFRALPEEVQPFGSLVEPCS